VAAAESNWPDCTLSAQLQVKQSCFADGMANVAAAWISARQWLSSNHEMPG